MYIGSAVSITTCLRKKKFHFFGKGGKDRRFPIAWDSGKVHMHFPFSYPWVSLVDRVFLIFNKSSRLRAQPSPEFIDGEKKKEKKNSHSSVNARFSQIGNLVTNCGKGSFFQKKKKKKKKKKNLRIYYPTDREKKRASCFIVCGKFFFFNLQKRGRKGGSSMVEVFFSLSFLFPHHICL